MALYRQGTASMDADGTVHGTDTKWKDQLALIRVGATIVFLEQPIKLAVISDIVSDTELKAISTDGQTAADGKYVILLSDSLTVNGLAQNVAETLRYYQSKETEIANAMDVIANLDMDNLSHIVEEIKANKSAAEAAQNQAELARDAANAARDEANATKVQVQQIVDGAVSNINAAKDKAITDIGAKESAAVTHIDTEEAAAIQAINDAKGDLSGYVNDAQTAAQTATSAKNDAQAARDAAVSAKDAAAVSAQEAKDAADSVDAGNLLQKNKNLSDVENKETSRKNLQVMYEKQGSLVNENLNDLKGDKAGFYYCSLSANATTEKNYPIVAAGCLLVQRTGANVPKSCVQTYTTYGDGRRWMRWIGNGATGKWSNWYEMFNSGSSPEFNAYVRAKSGERIVEMFVGGSDMGLLNRTSQKVLQLRDNGELAYDNKIVAYNGFRYSATFDMNVQKLAVHTTNGGYQIYGTQAGVAQPLYVAAYDSTGARLWYVGKDKNESMLMLNDKTSSKVELKSDGIVLGSKDFAGKVYAQAASLEIDRPSGKYFKMLNDGNSSHPSTFRLWGNNNDRKSVIEWGFDNGPGWIFYVQLNKDDSKLLQVNGPVNATAFNQGSDIELKENIKPIENARSGLSKVGGYTYTLKKDGMPYAGIIAQEFMDVVPEAVSSYEDYAELQGPTFDGKELIGKQRFFQVDYAAVAAYAVQVCKEQEDEIVSLRNDVEELKLIVKSLLKSK